VVGLADAVTGEVGLAVAVLLLLGYTIYENRRGTIAGLQKQTKALGTAVYRIAQENPMVDEQAVREEVYENGGDSTVFPEDFAADESDCHEDLSSDGQDRRGRGSGDADV